jgi:nicotinamide-nucleotide amidase
MRVEIIAIGDELLLGQTIDTNGATIGRALASLGIAITRRATVGDDADEIADAVASALSRADGVITTGGLGPTSDDRTKPAIAALFGRALEVHQPTIDHLEARWRARGLPGDLPTANRQQAMAPAGAQVLANRHGTAPGIWIENEAGQWVLMLPGVPREMRGMLTDTLLPRLTARVGADAPVITSRLVRTTGIAEARVADVLADLRLPEGIRLAYLPGWEGVDLRLTSQGAVAERAAERLAESVTAIEALLGPHIYATEERDLAAVTLDAFRRRGWRLAVAESCTGGLLGARLTAIAGSSDVVDGGIIAYRNAVKEGVLGVAPALLASQGAVSVEVAAAMAAGARRVTGADVGVGISGVAGPGGGTEAKPVGLVCLAIETPSIVWAEARHFIGDREEIRLRATQALLDRLRIEASRTSVDRSA